MPIFSHTQRWNADSTKKTPEHWQKIFPEKNISAGPSLPEFPHHTGIIYAGEKVEIPGSEYDRVKNSFEGIVDSAKDVRLSSGISFPWQKDKKGELFSTKQDILELEIGALRKKLGLKPLDECKPLKWEPKDGGDDVTPENFPRKTQLKWDLKTGRFDEVQEPLDQYQKRMEREKKRRQWAKPYRKYLIGKLINRELKLHRALKERRFRQKLRNWILGEAPPREYNTCYWVNQERAHDPDERVAWDEKQKMVRKTPSITKGFIDDLDSTPAKIGMFLSMLKSKIPETQEEGNL
jgi:hypothetical protein